MGALDNFLDAIPDNFDARSFFDDDVEAIEQTRYARPLIYKYYSRARRSFFTRPQVRFSQRETLNDPREMSRRWREARADGLRKFVEERIAETLPAAAKDKSLLVAMFAEEMVKKGQTLTTEQREQLENLLGSPAAQDFLSNQITAAQQMMQVLIEHFFSRLETELDQMLEKVTSSMGVLSLTENHLSEPMWAHYGDQLKGFVVGFDAESPFFFHSDGSIQRHLLRKVIYTNEPAENFWRNPYYLFLVKASDWSYEREWRVMKKLEDSHIVLNSIEPPVHLWNVPPEMIRTIHFGHRYGETEISEDAAALIAYGAKPVFYRVVVDRSAGLLEEPIFP